MRVDGALGSDPDQRRPGRGAYLCASAECATEAIRRRGFERAFRAPVAVPPNLLD